MVGVHKRNKKTGNTEKYTRNVYLHYLSTCFKECNQNFTFAAITVPALTLSFLPEGSRELFTEKGLQVQQSLGFETVKKKTWLMLRFNVSVKKYTDLQI